MSGEGLAVIMLIVFVLAMVLYGRSRWETARGDKRGLPRELRDAEVAYAERTFRSQRRGLVARLDRAYRVGGGIQLVELKTRARDAVYMADIIELSVQRVAVQDETGEGVALDAWVVVQNITTGARRHHRVTLLGVNEVEAMRDRYRALTAGQVTTARPARSVRQCETCGHRTRCVQRIGSMDTGERQGS